MDKRIVVRGKAPAGYRPMWNQEIMPETTIYDADYDGDWRSLLESEPGQVGNMFNIDEHVPHAVPIDHAPVFEREEEDEPQEPEIPLGFRRLEVGEEVPYYALEWVDGDIGVLNGDFCQVEYEHEEEPRIAEEGEFLIARVIPDGYDALGYEDRIQASDLYILAGIEVDEWEPYGDEGRHAIVHEYFDAVFIRKRLSIGEHIAQYIDEQMALTEKYSDLWEKTGMSGESFVLTEELARIKNAVKG